MVTVYLVRIQLPNPFKLHLHITGWIMLDLPVAIFWEIATMDLLWLLTSPPNMYNILQYHLLIQNASEKSSWVSQMKILYSAILVHISTIATHWSTPNTCWVELIRKIGTAWANSTSLLQLATWHMTHEQIHPMTANLAINTSPQLYPKSSNLSTCFSKITPTEEGRAIYIYIYTFLNQHLQRGAN